MLAARSLQGSSRKCRASDYQHSSQGLGCIDMFNDTCSGLLGVQREDAGPLGGELSGVQSVEWRWDWALGWCLLVIQCMYRGIYPEWVYHVNSAGAWITGSSLAASEAPLSPSPPLRQ
jgi:hypothetical protein